MREELEQHQRAILAIRKALTGDIHGTSDLLDDIAMLCADRDRYREALESVAFGHDEMCVCVVCNALCNDRKTENASRLEALMKEIKTPPIAPRTRWA